MRSFWIKLLVLVMLASPALSKEKKASKAVAKEKEGVEKTAVEPFTPSVKFNGLLQFSLQAMNNIWDMKVAHARLRATALVDENTTLALMPEMGPTGFVLLDAYGLRNLGDQCSLQAGQFKPAFGDDRYLTPGQLKRVNYTKMTGFVLPSATNAWDMGVEFKKVGEQVTFQADVIQGAGPNKSADNDTTKDLAGRLEWKDKNIALGCSYYGGTSFGMGFISYQNWLGVHGRYNSEGFDARAEAVWLVNYRSAYFAQAAYRKGDWEPVAWGELGFLGTVQNYQLIGGGINYWPAVKTRIQLNVSLSGVTDFSAPALVVLQAEQIF